MCLRACTLPVMLQCGCEVPAGGTNKEEKKDKNLNGTNISFPQRFKRKKKNSRRKDFKDDKKIMHSLPQAEHVRSGLRHQIAYFHELHFQVWWETFLQCGLKYYHL